MNVAEASLSQRDKFGDNGELQRHFPFLFPFFSPLCTFRIKYCRSILIFFNMSDFSFLPPPVEKSIAARWSDLSHEVGIKAEGSDIWAKGISVLSCDFSFLFN